MRKLEFTAKTKAGQIVNVTVEATNLDDSIDTVVKAEYNGKVCYARFSGLNNTPSVVLNKYQVKDLFGVKVNCDAQIALDRDYTSEYETFKKEVADMKKTAVKEEIKKLIQENTELKIVSHFVMNDRTYMVLNVSRLVSNELSTVIEKAVKAGKVEMKGTTDFESSRIDGVISIKDLYQAEMEADKKKAAELAEVEIRKNAEMDKAKMEAYTTGKDVIISSYSVDCDESEKDCNCDLITTFVTPEGKVKTVRVHTH